MDRVYAWDQSLVDIFIPDRVNYNSYKTFKELKLYHPINNFCCICRSISALA